MSHPNSHLTFIIAVLAIGLVSANFNVFAVGKFFLAQAGSSIGVSASVPPNPFNTLAQQLKEKEDELALREKYLNEKERALSRGDSDMKLYAVAGALFLLISFHFYSDFKKRGRVIGVQ